MLVMCYLLPWSAGNRSLTVTLACWASYWSDPAHADDDDCADVAGDYAGDDADDDADVGDDDDDDVSGEEGGDNTDIWGMSVMKWLW